MTPRRRLVVTLCSVAVLVGAAVVLRESEPNSQPPSSEPVHLADFTGPYLSAPPPQARPAAPTRLRSSGGRVTWDEVRGAAGYEVNGQRLIAAPEIQIDGEVSIRSVDAYGRRSGAATIRSDASHDESWKRPLTGLLDEFDEPHLERRWHLSSYRGCVEAGLRPGRLAFDMNCGADTATLRARNPLVLSNGHELGRVAVRTDAAGARGKLVIDLAPGTPDRIGPAMGASAIRVSIDDTGVVISGTRSAEAPLARGQGVPHLFEVVLTATGVRVSQDGTVIGSSPVVPSWREASVLVGVSTPSGKVGRAEIDAIGFSGPWREVPPVVETLTAPGTQRVLDMEEDAPGIGFARTPLKGATTARLRATVRLGDGGDPAGLVAQFGSLRVPLVPTTSEWSRTPDSDLSVVADVPATLMGTAGPDAVSPFVLRMPGASQAHVVESYLEVPGVSSALLAELPARVDLPEQPVLTAELISLDGELLDAAVPIGQDEVNLRIRLDGVALTSIAEIAGFEVQVDRRAAASVPTDRDGPGLGGDYVLGFDLSELTAGRHAVVVKLRPRDAAADTPSVIVEFTRSSR